ncbi:MAG: efflux RND transporter permease subunit [Planctomycetes bacterium]|nr:efflux RND transporter permease subunit [Planctomycetota bacterium]
MTSPPEAPAGQRHGHSMAWATKIVEMFIDSKLTPLILLFAVLVGAFSVIQLPREEEPQIIVPMIDIFVRMEGASPREIEQRVTKPMEKFLWEIPGVEYIYSTSSPGMSLAVVRFQVGYDEEAAIVKVNQKMAMHFDLIPAGVTFPLIKPRSIDDVPIMALTLWSPEHDHFQLRRVAGEVADAIKAIPDVSETTLIGGRRRQVRVFLDPAALAARGVTATEVLGRLQAANAHLQSGSTVAGGAEIVVETGRFLKGPEEVRRVVVGVFGGRPVHLQDVAGVEDGPDETADYVFFEPGPAFEGPSEHAAHPAVTISIAKRKGTNAISVARAVEEVVGQLKGWKIPESVRLTVTRNYGETAAEKSNELLLHMGIAVVSVTLLIWLILGWRESGIVAIAIPVTLALTLSAFYLLGYTLNRITLFALIFSIGILVDDPIVDVENIVRHFRMPQNRGRNLLLVTLEAINEVRSPLILATLTVVCAVLPMAFVRGLMGPYMRPIPIGASTAMAISMMVAFVITPWAAYRILRGPAQRGALHAGGEEEGLTTRFYRRAMRPIITSSLWRSAFLAAITLLLLGSVALIPLGGVVVKMLPFDNKSELQVIVDMPEGTTLEKTANLARELAAALSREPEVVDMEVYAGTAAPYNFNGLVRHYYLRRGSNVADLQVNLVGKHERAAQSHDFARRIRAGLEAIAQKHSARIKIAEVPPGPPVLQTLVAEVFHPDGERRLATAAKVRELFEATEGVVDVDWYVEDDQARDEIIVDEEKAALHGISVASISETIRIALEGSSAGLLHDEREKEDTRIYLQVPFHQKAELEKVLSLRVRLGHASGHSSDNTSSHGGAPPALVPLSELVRVERKKIEKSIHHKNLLPVTYVTADVFGREESPIYAILKLREKLEKQFPGELQEYWVNHPYDVQGLALKWDGEMHITVEVFRDLGLAFGAVLVLIYILVVGWFRSFTTPVVIMAAIPFSLAGILPAHWALGAFFTATSMIGFIAGAGIVVRNSIILVDFIELRLAEGMPLAEAVIDAGAVRFRPMLLTALAVIAGAGVILFDPIFQGLAISLMAGEVASLLLSRVAVPVLYYLRYR